MVKEGYCGKCLHGSIGCICHAEQFVDVQRLELHFGYPQVEHVLLRQQIGLGRQHTELGEGVLIERIDLGANSETLQILRRQPAGLLKSLGKLSDLLGLQGVPTPVLVHVLLVRLDAHLHALDLFLQLIDVALVEFHLVAEETLELLKLHRENLVLLLEAFDVLT